MTTRRRVTLDREVTELLRDEPELLAIADAIARTQRRQRRWRRTAPLAAAIAVVGAALAFLVVSPWKGHGIEEEALAAIGDQPIVHVVLEGRVPGVSLVDLSTGRSRPDKVETSLWYDEASDRLRAVVRRNGIEVVRIVETTEHTSSTAGRVRLNADRHGGLDPGVVAVATDYAGALERKQAEVASDGVATGQRVVWLRVPTRFGFAEQVAVDRATHLPVLVRYRSRTGWSSWRVVRAETLPFENARFAPPPPPALPPSGGRIERVAVVSPSEARALVPGALWSGRVVDGLRLEQIELQRLSRTFPPESSRGQTFGRGLELAYSPAEMPAAHVRIQEARAPEPAYGFFEAPLALAPVPPPGCMRLEQRAGPRSSGASVWVGQLRRGPLYVTITGSRRALVLAAARSLTPIRGISQ